jgi:hypothetical protein
MVGMFILAFGLLAAGQLLSLVLGGQSLARAKGNAAIVAQNRLEALAAAYHADPAASELSPGDHGPLVEEVRNPADGALVDRFSVSWTVAPVVTNGKTLRARAVLVTATPVLDSSVTRNTQQGLNKIVVLASVLGSRTP